MEHGWSSPPRRGTAPETSAGDASAAGAMVTFRCVPVVCAVKSRQIGLLFCCRIQDCQQAPDWIRGQLKISTIQGAAWGAESKDEREGSRPSRETERNRDRFLEARSEPRQATIDDIRPGRWILRAHFCLPGRQRARQRAESSATYPHKHASHHELGSERRQMKTLPSRPRTSRRLP